MLEFNEELHLRPHVKKVMSYLEENIFIGSNLPVKLYRMEKKRL